VSFLRPGIRTFWNRYKRALIPAAALVFLISAFQASLQRGDWAAVSGIGLAAAILAGLAVIEYRQARLARPLPGPGIVTITERRILYLGPHGGGTLALDDIARIDILTTDDHPAGEEAFWRLTARDGTVLVIPAAATGAEGFFDAFSALPGIDWAAVIAAMGRREPAVFAVWQMKS